MKGFKLFTEFQHHLDPNKLKTDRFPTGLRKEKITAIYLLEFKGKIIKVGQSINLLRRMSDYKYRQGHACKHLTPKINKMITDSGENVKVYVKVYNDIHWVDDEDFGRVPLKNDMLYLENQWKEKYKKNLIFS
jgi:hypothetical protein